jgi:hypothetical protein
MKTDFPLKKENYLPLIVDVYSEDENVQKIGFKKGKWIIENKSEKVAVSKNGYLLHFKYMKGHAYAFNLYLNIEDMGIDFF